jgi:hypothetical protein
VILLHKVRRSPLPPSLRSDRLFLFFFLIFFKLSSPHFHYHLNILEPLCKSRNLSLYIYIYVKINYLLSFSLSIHSPSTSFSSFGRRDTHRTLRKTINPLPANLFSRSHRTFYFIFYRTQFHLGVNFFLIVVLEQNTVAFSSNLTSHLDGVF